MIYFWSKGKVIHKNNTRRERKKKKNGLILLLPIINMKIPPNPQPLEQQSYSNVMTTRLNCL